MNGSGGGARGGGGGVGIDNKEGKTQIPFSSLSDFLLGETEKK